ncbi:MAG: Gfo/Idh/MocA family oxidoreductase [Planctomycetia bacterium]|nr:Gfo/Idh/MocA family oxidoreductase [Planctomycetia bacterium]
MKKVAIIGFGFMGRMHYGAWKKTRGAKVHAICDSNLAQLQKVNVGNLAGTDTSTDFTGIEIFEDYDALLQAGGFDIVDITLPTPLHPAMSQKALQAGYHVLCEKPMALSLKECDAMLAVAENAEGKFLIAQCLRFWPEYVYLKQLIDSGKYGEVKAADFSRFAAAPGRDSGGKSWFLDESKSGGVVLDLHIHDADMVNFLFGMPQTVTSKAHLREDGFLDHFSTIYGFPNKVVTSSASWAMPVSYLFGSEIKVVFENAVAVMNSKAKQPLTIYPAKGKPFEPKLQKATGYEAEIQYFLSLVNGTVKTQVLTPEDARDSIQLVLAERRSAKTNRTVTLAKKGA